MSYEGEYAVVSPAGRFGGSAITRAQGVPTLSGKRIGFVWNHLFRGDLMMEQILAAVRQEWHEVVFVDHPAFGNFHGPEEPKVMDQLPARLKEAEVDAVVIGVGACGSCTPAVMRACAVAEREGIPAVGLIAEGFVRQAEAIGRALGLADKVIARYPGVVMTDGLDTFHRKVGESMVPEAMDGLLRRAEATDDSSSESADPYRPEQVVFTGTLEAVQRYFEDRLWSDGLPILPPTLDAIANMLAHTTRDPHEVLGVALPANQEATVWNVAVNAVMSGCDPRHLPMLLAAVESILDPRFGIEHGGCTPGWEPFALISGPDLGELGFNSSTASLRLGTRANSTIGRFLRMFFHNVAGLVGPPGATDKATFGAPTHVALAENEEVTRELGWPTLREEQGFAPEDTTVAVQSVVGFSLPIYTEGETVDEHLRVLAEHIAGASGHWSHTGLTFKEWQPLLVMSPGIATVFARNGYSKDDIRRELGERARVPWSQWIGCTTAVGLQVSDLEERLVDGTARDAYRESDDPDRLVPVIPFPERLAIVVNGDSARNQSKYYVNNHVHGPRIPTRVRW
ncbi:UGSC family (seleno)protein [Nocardia jiangxiensis]|uniref:UGSC family (seleno)protein n=1 Tax=Nocardia jiangxiensis TaxID=282685 RepID=UPI00030D5E44|nr:hypothetical protein [Nocardia jiangxiensis]